MECSQPRILRGTAVSGALVSSFEEGIAGRANGCIQVLKYRVSRQMPSESKCCCILSAACLAFSISRRLTPHPYSHNSERRTTLAITRFRTLPWLCCVCAVPWIRDSGTHSSRAPYGAARCAELAVRMLSSSRHKDAGLPFLCRRTSADLLCRACACTCAAASASACAWTFCLLA